MHRDDIPDDPRLWKLLPNPNRQTAAHNPSHFSAHMYTPSCPETICSGGSMLALHRSASQIALPALIALFTAASFAQTPPAQAAPPASSCSALADTSVPTNFTVEAKVTSI